MKTCKSERDYFMNMLPIHVPIVKSINDITALTKNDAVFCKMVATGQKDSNGNPVTQKMCAGTAWVGESQVCKQLSLRSRRIFPLEFATYISHTFDVPSGKGSWTVEDGSQPWDWPNKQGSNTDLSVYMKRNSGGLSTQVAGDPIPRLIICAFYDRGFTNKQDRVK